MERKVLLLSALGVFTVLVLPKALRVAGQAGGKSREISKPYVSLASVTVSPREIHRNGVPNTATVTAKVVLHGSAPRGATATVDAYTGPDNEPIGNNVDYSSPVTLALSGHPTDFKFTVRPNRDTVTGRISIQVTIIQTSPGVSVLETARTAFTQLKTVVP